MVLSIILAALALLSLASTLWQWVVGLRFPLHQRRSGKRHAPPVTVLKPLAGADAQTSACLQSWLNQDYAGPVQVLFGVASPDDPAGEIVRRLIEAHPKHDAQLIVCGESLGANAKVSTLIQLQRRARHERLVVSDADVFAPPELLAELAGPLFDPGVGLVHCFYRLANPSTAPMQWEAVAINADFWSQVLQSRSLKPLDFALGAVMAITRGRLDSIGGFPALADFLADDYQLGHLISRQGGAIVLCPVVVECRESPKTWGEVWRHQLRWARTIRVCQPLPYFFSILGNATLWPLLCAAAGAVQWLGESHPLRDASIQAALATVTGPRFDALTQGMLLVALCCLLVRIVSAMWLQSRLEQSGRSWRFFWIVLLKDLLSVPIWALAFLGDRIEWRGRCYRIRRGGRLEKIL